MNAGCARKLCQASEDALGFVRRHQHEVGQLIDHHHPGRQALFAQVGGFRVEIVQVAGARLREAPVALVHLARDPLQRRHHALEFDNYRREEMRDAVVGGQFHPFRVDHQEAQRVGRVMQQEAADERVDTHRLP